MAVTTALKTSKISRRPTIYALQFMCGVLFFIDLIYEIGVLHLNNTEINLAEAIHLSLEALAVVLLFVGYFTAVRHENLMELIGNKQDQMLTSFRVHFDVIIHERFRDWDLSPAESDIALLTVRGMRITEIADARGSKSGTVKAQLHAIYHKAGVSTRAGLMALFMDDFLDFGAEAEEDSFLGENSNP